MTEEIEPATPEDPEIEPGGAALEEDPEEEIESRRRRLQRRIRREGDPRARGAP